MQADSALVTVVVPVWGLYVDRYLQEAVDSVRAQDMPARIVVIDNASDTPVHGLQGVTVVRAPTRLTLGGARNAGLAAVETPYVIFWDADDFMPHGALHALGARATDDEGAVVVTGRIMEGLPSPRHHWPRRWTTWLAPVPPVFALVHCVSSLFPTVGVLIRTDVVRAAGGFADTDAGDDWILGVSLAFRGRVSFIDDATRLYRTHPGSVSDHWRSTPHIVANARGVRDRVRGDGGVPQWAKTLLPIIALLQAAVIFGLRPLARSLRRCGAVVRSIETVSDRHDD